MTYITVECLDVTESVLLRNDDVGEDFGPEKAPSFPDITTVP